VSFPLFLSYLPRIPGHDTSHQHHGIPKGRCFELPLVQANCPALPCTTASRLRNLYEISPRHFRAQQRKHICARLETALRLAAASTEQSHCIAIPGIPRVLCATHQQRRINRPRTRILSTISFWHQLESSESHSKQVRSRLEAG
jgi:hypothetical protein